MLEYCLVKAADVHVILKHILGPTMREAGFRRTASSTASWYIPQDNKYLVVWGQVSQYGGDRYAGSRFKVHLALADEPTVRSGQQVRPESHRRSSLSLLLSLDERLALRQLQDNVVAAFEKPSDSYVAAYKATHGSYSLEQYLTEFEPDPTPYREGRDVWHRYARPRDVEVWAGFLAILPQLAKRLLSQTSHASN